MKRYNFHSLLILFVIADYNNNKQIKLSVLVFQLNNGVVVLERLSSLAIQQSLHNVSAATAGAAQSDEKTEGKYRVLYFSSFAYINTITGKNYANSLPSLLSFLGTLHTTLTVYASISAAETRSYFHAI